ncbi:MAG: TonB-dependent receptor plug domain-containing protein, partial [Ginsengibacter sp.]
MSTLKIQAVQKRGNAFVIIAMLCQVISTTAFCQDDSLQSISLPSITIKAFEQNKKLKDIPAAISYVNQQTLRAFSNTSVVQALNTSPGIRMEERSPGSYRINIRGSSLRSPFGVRNVKIYYNDLVFTDPGGQSYLNQLGYYNFNSVEIIKGANSSLYGAGNGGVMLIESMKANDSAGLFAEYTTGSFGLQNGYISATTKSENVVNKIGVQFLKSNGYRDHSNLRKTVLTWNTLIKSGKNNTISTSFLYGDQFYETPGALTFPDFSIDPKQSRPATAVFPSAIDANAAIYQKMFLTGASYHQQFTANFFNKTSVYGMFTQLRNPNINNYDYSSEPHAGGRTVFSFIKKGELNIQLDGGAEIQKGFTTVKIYKNNAGNADTLRSSDDINNRQYLLFTQATLDIGSLTISAGSSFNNFIVNFQRFSPATNGLQKTEFKNQWSPRFALMKKFEKFNLYSSIARGFSPPTTSELLPTGGLINAGLLPENGITTELGIKSTLLNNKIYIDINGFFYSLKNAIVQRRDAGGGNYFINAGKTKQRGLEALLNCQDLFVSHLIKSSRFWLAYTFNDFHYKDFMQLAENFAGNKLPSVPQHTISSGFSASVKNFTTSINYLFNSKVPLNDANNQYAKSYHLLGAKATYRVDRKQTVQLFAGADNLLDQTYSLGNDINGFGGRYYNTAPKRNYYLGINFT